MPCQYQHNPGDRLDSFTITKPMFCGALSEVYRGTDALTHQTVAIKVPSLDIINTPLVYYHFQNETQVLDRINHPSIVRHILRDRSAAYSVFEYIAGRDLRTQMKDTGPLALGKARHYIRQIGQGLSYIHDCGIIHMDIKPENIIITPMDTIKIIDFGLARRLGAADVLQEDFTRPHGTPYYAAPEQLEHYRDDPRTDLYSLAIVLYEMLTGELPFERTLDLKKVRRRLKTDPIPPRTYRKTLSEAVEAVILKALSREPTGRYPSVDAFVRALDEADAYGAPVRAEPAPDPFGTPQACPVRPPSPRPDARYHHILAALDDNDKAETIVETALLEALNDRAAVTLLTVVSGNDNDDWTRYADEVKGHRWGRRLEAFARRLRRFGIMPTVRIRSGNPADLIVETARKSGADLIVMGVSKRAWFRRIFGGRTLNRVLNKAPCQVKIADAPLPSEFPWEADPGLLPPATCDQIDRYLLSLWTRQLNWLATRVQGLLAGPAGDPVDETQPDPLAGWIADIGAQPQWTDTIARVSDAHRCLRRVEERMILARNENDLRAVGKLYAAEALPLLCRLRSNFKAMSNDLRGKSTAPSDRPSRLLDQTDCPIDLDHNPAGGLSNDIRQPSDVPVGPCRPNPDAHRFDSTGKG